MLNEMSQTQTDKYCTWELGAEGAGLEARGEVMAIEWKDRGGG